MTINMTKKKTKTTSLWQISFSWSFNIFCHFSVSYVMFLSCFIVFLYVFMILVCDVSCLTVFFNSLIFVDFTSLFIGVCHFSMGFFPFCFLFFSLVFFTSSLVFFYCVKCFLYFFFGFDWFVNGCVALMLENERNDWKTERQWQENDRKMTEKHDKKNTSFWQVSFSWIQNICDLFCHVFVMFDWCPWCFHDSSVWCTIWISMRHLECLLNTGDEIGFLKNGWSKSLWKWGATKLSHTSLRMPPQNWGPNQGSKFQSAIYVYIYMYI